MINNKLNLLVALPLTKELTLCARSSGFAFKWLDIKETQWEIKSANSKLFNELQIHLNEVSIYQREPFSAGSLTHQWLWHYEEGIPARIRIATSKSERIFIHKESLGLLPHHYGKVAMQGYINEELKKLEKKYLEVDQISMFIGSWNCAGTLPRENILDWLKCINKKSEYLEKKYDVIVISLQEACALTTKNILGNTNCQETWIKFIISQVKEAFPQQKFETVRITLET